MNIHYRVSLKEQMSNGLWTDKVLKQNHEYT